MKAFTEMEGLTIVAALRHWQDNWRPTSSPYVCLFGGKRPLDRDEIDQLLMKVLDLIKYRRAAS